MAELEQALREIAAADVYKIVISKPSAKDSNYQKIVVEQKESYYQAAAYTAKQVFHQNIPTEELAEYLVSTVTGVYLQVNAWEEGMEHMLLISKKGKVSYQRKKATGNVAKSDSSHNRKKQYLLKEGEPIPPLVDMGIFTEQGKVVKSMYDKFRQINRFLEIIEDAMKEYPYEQLNIIDFGCGKSYLTFVLYYYFAEIKKRDVTIVGLDLKEDVIRHCNEAAERYGYKNLHFEVGDINGYHADFPVDMVVTLHACDTATDYALAKAVGWGASVILSVPCCQHELNRQIHNEVMAPVFSYGVLKERIAALMTDGLRAQMLEQAGYDTQILEFIDMEHTPKNLLIRAVYTGKKKENDEQLRSCLDAFGLHPTLERLLKEGGREA